ncbi:hypothetical protein [Nocardioides perillae]|uniref:PH domain-containing protein n=1 Tax=Nocardioides perillae TaxID=1119534 RepID=A0A7Y9RUJ1_9ACTN|nr:hypothetical protein [Nocardioides perillae]NYG55143.1 hypothetical protein [Nocardioides perillae]
MAARTDGGRERLPRSGTRLWAFAGYAVALALLVGTLADGLGRTDLVGAALALLAAGATTVVYVRPAVELDGDELHLRRMLSTVVIPLAAVEKAVVSRFLAVFAGERRYVSTTVQRTLRAVVGARSGRGGAAGAGAGGGATAAAGGGATAPTSEADLVEQRIAQAAADARRRHGVALLSDEQLALASQVRRTWSWPAVAAVVGPAVLVVLALLLV